MTATSRQHIELCFSELRALGFQPPPTSASEHGFQFLVGAWHDQLKRFDPAAVTVAFQRWGQEREGWPMPKGLLPMVRDAQAAHVAGLPKPKAPLGELNTALERLLSRGTNRQLNRLHALHQAAPDPNIRRVLVNRLAEWALAFGDVPTETANRAVDGLLDEAERACVDPVARAAWRDTPPRSAAAA